MLIRVVVSDTCKDDVVEEEASELQQLGETTLVGIFAKRDLECGKNYMGIKSYGRKTKGLRISLK